MELETTDRFSAELDEIARRSPHATFYHTATWLETLGQVFPSMEFSCIVARDGKNAVGYLPFFVVRRPLVRTLWSLPFGTYGGPVVAGDDGAFRALLEAYVALRRGRGIHEVGVVDFANRIGSHPFKRSAEMTHVLALDSGFEAIWKERFEKSKRRQTRKAEREGIRVVEATTVEEVERYHEIYVERSREWGQRIVYPRALFTEVFRSRRDDVRLFLAYDGDTLLGGHLNFYFRDTVIAWNGVTTKDSRSAQAGTLLYATCIRHACENGFRSYNLGASLGKSSLVEYKESLGGAPYRYHLARWRSLGGTIAAAVRRCLVRS